MKPSSLHMKLVHTRNVKTPCFDVSPNRNTVQQVIHINRTCVHYVKNGIARKTIKKVYVFVSFKLFFSLYFAFFCQNLYICALCLPVSCKKLKWVWQTSDHIKLLTKRIVSGQTKINQCFFVENHVNSSTFAVEF